MGSIYSIFLLLGGIALFLYGISYMTGAIEKAAGDNLRTVLEKTTSRGIFAVLVGAFVTAMIQSSGACGVMVVGFVTTGLMTLVQALYVMLGANIGTTITAQIIAFKIETIAPLILFIGMVMFMFIKNKTVKKIGAVVLGFGMLFVGIYLMGDAISQLNLGTIIEAFLNRVSNPFLSLLFGFVFTAIIQSSSASIGILQVLLMSSATSLGLESVIYIIIGMNIGACSPILISSFSGNKASKRAALGNVATKIIGAALFSLLMLVVPNLLTFIKGLSPDDVSRQIANTHLIFNLVSSVLLLPLVKPLAKLLYRLIPEDPAVSARATKLLYISSEALVSPTVAALQAKREVMRMAELTRDNFKLASRCFLERSDADTEQVFETEKTINFLNHSIAGFLVELNGKKLSLGDSERVGMMFKVITDIERIGDHAENIAEYARIMLEHNVVFSDEANEEIHQIFDRAVRIIEMAVETYRDEIFENLEEVSRVEEEVDGMQEQFTENHIRRLKEEKCKPREGVMFTDIITDLERCADHAINIAYAINGENSVNVKKSYVITRGDNID